MTSAVFGCPPVRLVATGDEHPANAASVTPPPAARNWRRDSPVTRDTPNCGLPSRTCGRLWHGWLTDAIRIPTLSQIRDQPRSSVRPGIEAGGTGRGAGKCLLSWDPAALSTAQDH